MASFCWQVRMTIVSPISKQSTASLRPKKKSKMRNNFFFNFFPPQMLYLLVAVFLALEPSVASFHSSAELWWFMSKQFCLFQVKN